MSDRHIPYVPALLATPVVVGQRVNVLHSVGGYNYYDLDCGDTTVVSIRKTGSFRLANGLQFKANGLPLSTNKACRVGAARYAHNDCTLTMRQREDAFVKYFSTNTDCSEDDARARWRSFR